MLDPNLFSTQPDVVRMSLQRRGMEPSLVDPVIALNVRRRALQHSADTLRQTRNETTQTIGALVKSGPGSQTMESLKASVREISAQIASIDADLAVVAQDERDMLLSLPNLVDAETPDGTGDRDNPIVRQWGVPREFLFPAQPHDEIARTLGMYAG